MSRENFTLLEAAEYARCSEGHIRREAIRGNLKGSKATGHWVFRKQWIDSWLDAGCPKPKPKQSDPMPSTPRSEAASLRALVSQ